MGTKTNAEGDFTLFTDAKNLPLVLVVSADGYAPKEVLVQGSTGVLMIRLKYQALSTGQDLVVSASRVEENILTSPVSVEKMGILTVQSAISPNFYDQIAHLKGIDVSTQSLLFKSINPRGFGTSNNVRTVQLIDGIDNQVPGLSFSVGNVVGISELDVESVEVLLGASSALYGPNALNGIILMNSKSPFEYQGLSANVTTGVTHADGQDRDPALYQRYALRYAHAFNDRWAFKVNGEFTQAGDFVGVDYRDQQGGGVRGQENLDPVDRSNRRTYDGVNVYGDPLLNLGAIGRSDPRLAQAVELLPSDETGNFTPTGYTESRLVDNTTRSMKLGAALHYRINDNVEVLAQYNLGSGDITYTANDRIALNNFFMQTAKAELRGTNFFVRAYRTQEHSGDTYSLGVLASQINAHTTIPRYVSTFIGARQRGASVDHAHADARRNSDALRAQNLENGRFQTLFDSLRAVPISWGGARFVDNTSLWHYEGMYNFSKLIQVAEVIVGANFRRYYLNTRGTVFALQDNGDENSISEWGTYVQVAKRFFNKLKLTGSVRYDKNENFTGQFSPRLSGVYTVRDHHHFRASYQRAFRIPTAQNQWINVGLPNTRLLGRNPALIDRYKLTTNQPYLAASVERAQSSFERTGSVNQAVALLEPVAFGDFETEKVDTYEVGYRGMYAQNLTVDAYYYYSAYADLLTSIDVVQPARPEGAPADVVRREVGVQSFNVPTNMEGTIETHGFAVGAHYTLGENLAVGGNVTFTDLLERNSSTEGVGFNAPRWRYTIELANRRVTDRFGFSAVWHWQQSFLWEAAFGRGRVPSYRTLDAQVSYQLPALMSTLKLGGTNVLNERYTDSFGNPRLGAIYYVSVTFNGLTH